MSTYRIKKVSKYCDIKNRAQDFYSVEYKILGLIWVNINWLDWTSLMSYPYEYRTVEKAQGRIDAHKICKSKKCEIIGVK